MSDQTLSLFHHTAPPRNGLNEKPPLLLLLHGYGANEDDLFSLAPYLDERFLIISARAPVSLQRMSYAWFSLGFTPQGVTIDAEEAEESRQTLHKFIGEVIEYYQVDANAVYLVGFSQGAMMSLDVALIYPGSVTAVAVMSGRVLPQTIDQIKDPDSLIGLPIFLAHGTRDTVVPIQHARETRAKLSELPVNLTYREYEMGHEVSADSLDDIANWLKEQLDHSAEGAIIN